jgi:ATP-dependent helicase/DNAse subunit B
MVLFLDIDGVMVPAKNWKGPELMVDGFPAFSAKATHALQQLIAEGADIVLTTSHKANFTLEEWKNIFRRRGINIERIKSLPANICNLNRKDEIVNWYNLNAEKDIVIIDDDKSLNGLPSYLKERLVLTSPLIGLTDEHVEMVNAIKRKNKLRA